MEEQTTPPCSSAAEAVWLNNVVRGTICDLADNSVLAKIAQLARASFDLAVPHLWAGGEQPDYVPTDLETWEGRLEEVRSAIEINDDSDSGIAPYICRFPSLSRLINCGTDDGCSIRRHASGTVEAVEYFVGVDDVEGDCANVMRECRAAVPSAYPVELFAAERLIVDNADELRSLVRAISKHGVRIRSIILSGPRVVADEALTAELSTLAAHSPPKSVEILLDCATLEVPQDVETVRVIVDPANKIIGKDKLSAMAEGPYDGVVTVLRFWLEKSDIMRHLAETSMHIDLPDLDEILALEQLDIPSYTSIDRDEWPTISERSYIQVHHEVSARQTTAERRAEILHDADRWLLPLARVTLYVGGPATQTKLCYKPRLPKAKKMSPGSAATDEIAQTLEKRFD